MMLLLLVAPLVSAELGLINEKNNVDPIEECRRETNEESCEAISKCDWVLGKCYFKVEEGCNFARDEDSCGMMRNCVWMVDDRTRSVGICTNPMDLNQCSYPGYRVISEASCNAIKGCSWVKGAALNACIVAPTHLECDRIVDKKSCRQQGCFFQKRKQSKTCTGRWEHVFLSSLKKRDGEAAKRAIEEEYGTDIYSVVLIPKTNEGQQRRKREPRLRKRTRTRIRIYLDRKGRVKGTPKFG